MHNLSTAVDNNGGLDVTRYLDQQFAKIFPFRTDFRSRTCRATRGLAGHTPRSTYGANWFDFGKSGYCSFDPVLGGRDVAWGAQKATPKDVSTFFGNFAIIPL